MSNFRVRLTSLRTSIVSHTHTQVGVVAFGFAKTANEAPNPMSMLSSMMQGGAGGGMDMNNMMSMLQGMQQGGKR